MRNRRLQLKRETLSELGAADLAGVVGGMSGPTCLNCGSDFQQCITGVGCLTLDGCIATLDHCAVTLDCTAPTI